MQVQILMSEEVVNTATFKIDLKKDVNQDILDDLWVFMDATTYSNEPIEYLKDQIEEYLKDHLGLEEDDYNISLEKDNGTEYGKQLLDIWEDE